MTTRCNKFPLNRRHVCVPPFDFADRSKIFFFFLYFCQKDLPLFRFEFSLACLVCFRRPAGSQGEEQEDGGGDGGGFPGYPEHVIPPAFKQTNKNHLTLNTCLKNTPWTFQVVFDAHTPFLCKWIHSGSFHKVCCHSWFSVKPSNWVKVFAFLFSVVEIFGTFAFSFSFAPVLYLSS